MPPICSFSFKNRLLWVSAEFFLKSWELFEGVGNFLKVLGTFCRCWELFLGAENFFNC